MTRDSFSFSPFPALLSLLRESENSEIQESNNQVENKGEESQDSIGAASKPSSSKRDRNGGASRYAV